MSAHSPTTCQDMSQGNGNQHCHIHPFTLPSYQDDSKGKKIKNISFFALSPYTLQHTLNQSLQSSFSWEKNHEVEQGKGSNRTCAHKKKQLLERTQVCFSERKAQGFLVYFG